MDDDEDNEEGKNNTARNFNINGADFDEDIRLNNSIDKFKNKKKKKNQERS